MAVHKLIDSREVYAKYKYENRTVYSLSLEYKVNYNTIKYHIKKVEKELGVK